MDVTEQSASGIRTLSQAVTAANGFANMHSINYVVLWYPSLKEFDVEPAKTLDEVGNNFVAHISRPEAS